MTPINEIEAIKELAKVLSQLTNSEERKRVLDWACAKYSPSSGEALREEKPGKLRKTKSGRGKKRGQIRSQKINYAIVRDLNLRPKGKESFRDFVTKKLPNKSTAVEICLMAVYYLKKVLNIPNVSSNHVYTCFKDLNARVPANLENKLSVVKSTTSWIETSNKNDLGITTIGENYVEFDLPLKKGKASK